MKDGEPREDSMGGNDIGGSVELLRENEGFEQSLHNAHISLRNVPSSQLQVLYLLLLMYSSCVLALLHVLLG